MLEGDELSVIEKLAILLAEDNIINQKVAARILEKKNHSVKVVSNGEEAVKAVSNGSFDVVLMDIQMPVLDGLEATKKIRSMELDHLANIPIVALTAHAMNGDRERFIEAGMDDYSSKPFNAEELIATIERVVRDRKSR